MACYQFPAEDDDGVDDDDGDGEGGENDECDHPDITDRHRHRRWLGPGKPK